MNYDILGNAIVTLTCLPSLCASRPFYIARAYTYDAVLGKRTQESYYTTGTSGTRIDQNMTYSYAGELTGMSNSTYGSVLSSMANTVFGPTNYTYGNGLNGVQAYDTLGRASGLYVCSNSTSSSCSGGSQTYGMTQAVAGARVTSMYDSVLGANATPGYDEFNRLSTMTYTNPATSSTVQAFSYIYDRYGNRQSQNVTAGSGPSFQLGMNVNDNQVAGYNYDLAGNVIADGTHGYTYDAEGNILNVDNGSTATYVYDAFNHRVRETINTPSVSSDTYYTFNTDGQRVSSWTAGAGTPSLLSAYTYWNGRPLATYSSTATFYSHQDLLGTKRLITDASGNTPNTFASLPFGDGYTPTGTDPDPSHFAMLDHDAESNTDHAQFRQYSPTSATWMSPDPYDGSYDQTNPQSFNRYVYAGNNPLMYVDISGKDYTICDTPVGPGQTMPAGYQYTAATSGCFTYTDEDWYDRMRDGYGGGNTGPPQGISGTVSAPDGEVWAMITYTNPDGSQGQYNPYQTPTPFAPNNGTNYDPNNPQRETIAQASARCSVVGDAAGAKSFASVGMTADQVAIAAIGLAVNIFARGQAVKAAATSATVSQTIKSAYFFAKGVLQSNMAYNQCMAPGSDPTMAMQ